MEEKKTEKTKEIKKNQKRIQAIFVISEGLKAVSPECLSPYAIFSPLYAAIIVIIITSFTLVNIYLIRKCLFNICTYLPASPLFFRVPHLMHKENRFPTYTYLIFPAILLLSQHSAESRDRRHSQAHKYEHTNYKKKTHI